MSRLKKWQAHFNDQTIAKKIKAHKEHYCDVMAEYFQIAEQLENLVKKIVGEYALPTWHNIPYHNFARKLYKLYTHHQNRTLKNKVDLEIKLAERIRLNPIILRKIVAAVEELIANRTQAGLR